MDHAFAEKENVVVLPMEIYYAWNPSEDVENAKRDVWAAEKYRNKEPAELTPYLEAVLSCEYVINVSGDMWGDNAEHVGHDRFLVDCLKMRAAQLLKKKTILYAVTSGPFSDETVRGLARQVFASFDRVFIRETISGENLLKWGFPVEHVKWAPCPSFLFEENRSYTSKWTEAILQLHAESKNIVGMTFGGFNMPYGPYDMSSRPDEQYRVFAELAKFILKELKAGLLLFSHTNGFELPPHFKLIPGRDYAILEQFFRILMDENPEYKNQMILIDEPLLPCDLKKVIGSLDMLVTGRVHASVASVSQCFPTVYLEYSRNVIYSDKMMGFSSISGMQEFVCVPEDVGMLKEKTGACYRNRKGIKQQLKERMPSIKQQAAEAFEDIKRL